MENIIIKILENKEKAKKEQAKQSEEWGISQRNKLVKVLEKEGATISNNIYDMLLFNINGLRVNDDGKVCYLSFSKPSKKIIGLLARYNETIKDNFNFITK
jgi:hypothetical protein